MTYTINKVAISATGPMEAKHAVEQYVKEKTSGYICVSNVRTVAIANKDAAYRNIMEGALMCLPDGMPLVWMARLWGLKDVQRTTGPDLFVRILSEPKNGIKHFLLGDTEETLAALKAKYPQAHIVGTYSPPFCELEEYNYQEIADRINASDADIVWISMRAPKQDFFAVNILPLLDKKLCIGVGAAFHFALGEIKHPPAIIKKLGLTGLLWRKLNIAELMWYAKHSVQLIIWAMAILCSRMKGVHP